MAQNRKLRGASMEKGFNDLYNKKDKLYLYLNIVQVWYCHMRIVNFSDARNRLKSVLDQVVGDYDYTVISRRDAEDAVVMSLAHFNGLMETVHLLKTPANAAHLAKSIKQYRAGNVETHGLVDG